MLGTAAMHRRLIAIPIAVLLIGAALWVFPAAKRETLSRSCLGNMKSMGYAATVWAKQHGNTTPTNWLAFSEELISARLMLCPADAGRTPASTWSTFGPGNTSYEIVGADGRWGDSNRVFIRCKVHGHVGLADGSVCPRLSSLKDSW